MTENLQNTAESGQELAAVRGGDRTFTPRVDIVETEEALLLYADLPGVRADQVDLRYEHGELTLQGNVSARDTRGRLLFAEYERGNFQRIFQLSEAIDATRIDAEF